MYMRTLLPPQTLGGIKDTALRNVRTGQEVQRHVQSLS
jgi:hypothetical protein